MENYYFLFYSKLMKIRKEREKKVKSKYILIYYLNLYYIYIVFMNDELPQIYIYKMFQIFWKL